MRFVLGESVRRITHVTHGESAERTEASSIVSLVFESGIIGSIITSFETGYRHTAIEFLGSTGSVMAENFTPSNVVATVTTKTAERGDVVRTTEEKIAVPDLYTLEIAHFSDCILNGAEPSISNDSSLHNQWVLEQAMTMAHEK
jgi:predicted dehydrogenase